MIDTTDQNKMEGEEPSLHHLLKERKGQQQRTINTIYDAEGVLQDTSINILRAFAGYFKDKYGTKPNKTDKIHTLLDSTIPKIPDEAREHLEEHISTEELYQAIQRGKLHKSPGQEEIPLEFYKLKWNTIKTDLLQILNEIYIKSNLTATQKQGKIVCIPKKKQAQQMEDYRPVIIQNTDFKLLTSIISNRLKLMLPDLLPNRQHCGIAGSSIFDAIASIKDAVAYAEEKKKPLCLLSLDFRGAFDNISHEYMDEMIKQHCFSDTFRKRLQPI
jgi:hypothetical protein